MRASLTSLQFVLATFLVAGCQAKPPDFERMPRRLGSWECKGDTPLSPKLLAAVGADLVINRVYKNSDDEAIQIPVHLAVFSNHDTGMYHNPMTAYKAAGWKLLSEAKESVPLSHGKSISVSLSEWEKNADRIVVLFWYQFGDHTVFKRGELDKIRSEPDQQEQPPRLVKVHLQINKSHDNDAKDAIKQLASKIAKWLATPFYDR